MKYFYGTDEELKQILQEHAQMKSILSRILAAHELSSVDWDAMRDAKEIFNEEKQHISGAGPALHTQAEIAALWDKHTQRRTKK